MPLVIAWDIYDKIHVTKTCISGVWCVSKQENDFDTGKDRFLLENYFDEEDEEQNYTAKMIEYQNNQFNPGYYIGTGKVPTHVKASGNPLPLAIWMFIQATGLIAFYCLIIKLLFFPTSGQHYTFTGVSPLLDFVIITVAFLALTFICIWFGVVYAKKAKAYLLRKKKLGEEEARNPVQGDDQIWQRTCPKCGKKHDIDYPRCPYCHHSYTVE